MNIIHLANSNSYFLDLILISQQHSTQLITSCFLKHTYCFLGLETTCIWLSHLLLCPGSFAGSFLSPQLVSILKTASLSTLILQTVTLSYRDSPSLPDLCIQLSILHLHLKIGRNLKPNPNSGVPSQISSLRQPCHPGKWQQQPDTQTLQFGATPDSHILDLNGQKTWLLLRADTSRTHSTPHHVHSYSSWGRAWGLQYHLSAQLFRVVFLLFLLLSFALNYSLFLQGRKLNLIKSMVILCSLDHTTPGSKPLGEFLNDPTNCLCLISYHIPSMHQLWHFHSKTYFHPRYFFFWVVPCALKVVLQNICMIQSLAFLLLFQCYPSEASSAHVI